MRPYIFVKTVEDTMKTDVMKTDVLIINWEYAYNGVVLELDYAGYGTEKDMYKKFVDCIDQAVNDGVLPLQLGKYNWTHWVAIENHSTPRQYSVITDSAGKTTIFWKSTFVEDFFANGMLASALSA